MKISKVNWLIHGIVAIMFSVIVFLIWENKDFRFWVFWIYTLISLGNTLIVCGYIGKTHEKNSELMDYSLFVPPLVSYLGFLYLFIKGKILALLSPKKYLAISLLIFTISVIMQILLVVARKSNMKQEKEAVHSRLYRNEVSGIWKKIGNYVQDQDLKKLAKNIEQEILYSDPMSMPELSNMEQEINFQSIAILKRIQDQNDFKENLYEEMEEVLNMVKERNEKMKLMK